MHSARRAQASELLSAVARKMNNPRLATLAVRVRLDAFTRVCHVRSVLMGPSDVPDSSLFIQLAFYLCSSCVQSAFHVCLMFQSVFHSIRVHACPNL